MATATVDSAYLSAYLELPQPTLDSIIDAPTVELVQAVLQAVTAKARQHEELQADKLRADIELESAVRGFETRSQGLKTTIDKGLKDVEELREKLNNEENSRSALESELQKFKSSSTTSSSEADSLRARITTLEAANRDTVAALNSKSVANDSISEDLQKQHKKGLELSQQVSTLQQSIQSANSAVSSAKFREQSLKQELEQAKHSNEWLDAELKTKSAEALKYRKEKGARIAELQRLNEDTAANLDALKRTELALRNRLTEVQKKAEESLAKVQQLQEAAATTEEGFRQELEGSRRLAELQSQQTETHRNRLKEVEATLEKVKDDAADQISRYQQEAEAEAHERESLESRVAELESEIDRLQAAASAPVYAGSVPSTPRQGINGAMGRAGSPATFGTPGSIRAKSSITATQAMDELYKVKGQLTTERRRNERLSAEMEEIIQSLEAKQPEVEELQAEYDRLQQEVVGMSKFVDQTGKERDLAKKSARKAESEAATSQTEVVILGKQLRDLSAQVKVLLAEVRAHEQGLGSMSAVEREQFARLALGEVTEDAFEGLTDTDRFISERLVIFRNVVELQNQNQELLKITRQLGAQMESEEAVSAKNQAAKDHQQVQLLEKRIEGYQDELKSMVTQSNSYIKERDMFRRMLQHRGQLPQSSDLASLFGQSVDGSGIMPSVEQTPNDKDNANYRTLLRELQSHFDQYREEQNIDRKTLKEQTEKLSTEKGSLQADIAKYCSQLTLATERYEMLHANYTMLQNENGELQKRSQLLSESAAKQDLRTQQVAEDLIEAKGLVESMRNETANLKAEKKLWKDIQDRLNKDNEALMNERSRLNGLIANQQILENERELHESETRRRLQTQVENLEAELNATKRKLVDEVEDNKKAQLRKEYDSQQSQKRIDDLAATLSSIREELIAAKTSRDHLQARVDELLIQLKSAEERVEVLQPKPTPRPGTQTSSTSDVPEDSISREQELAIEVSELRRDLDLTKSELENAKEQMEHYKSISQASEEDLERFTATHDEYRIEMDSIVEVNADEIRKLKQRIEDITTELSNANTELSTIRDQQAEVTRRADEEKAVLEVEIVRLKDLEEQNATAAQFHREDLRAQAEIATKAQQDYENELVKHAEAAKILQNLRADYNVLKSESVSLKSEAESAQVTLSQNQSSWEERREQFERELNELRTRRDDVSAQNRILLQQLESVSAQVAALQQSRASFSESGEFGTPASTTTVDPSVEGLRELVTYLRRDKEIVDVQYELSIQEAKRLRQQLEYAQTQLDESRLKLDQERRSQADGSRSTLAHKDLMEKLNELNLFRESSITLRNEARQAQTLLAEKAKEIERLEESISPLRSQVLELENTKEMQDGEIRLLHEDRDRWKKRNEDILSKYDRIDPAEMELLKTSVTTLQVERDTLSAGQQPLQEKILELETANAGWQVTRQKIIDQAKERSRILTKDRNDRTAERDAVIKEKEALEQQLVTIRQDLESSITDKQAVEQQLTVSQEELSTARSELGRAAAASTEQTNTDTIAPISESILQQSQENTEQLAAVRNELEIARQEKLQLDQQLATLRQELDAAKLQRDHAFTSLAEARSEAAIRASKTAIQNGLEDGQVTEDNQSSIAEVQRKALEERATAAEEKAKELEANLDAKLKSRSDQMKTALNKRLAESKEATKVALEAEYALKLEQEKKIWQAENGHLLPKTSDVPKAAESEQTGPIVTPATPTSKGTANLVTPATPSDPATPALDSSSMTDSQVRELLSNNPTIRKILATNLQKKMEIETQKVKDEFEKSAALKLAEIEKKAEDSKAKAVDMEGKKHALRFNMAENRAKSSSAKLAVVEKAAKETPQKPVVEVWEIAKDAKPPVVAAPAVQPVSVATPPGNPVIKPEVSGSSVPQPSNMPQPTTSTIDPSGPAALNAPTANGMAPAPTSNIPAPSTQATGPPRTGIPTRGGTNMRGRGGPAQYQAPRNNSIGGRGRGGGMNQSHRGGGNMNPSAHAFNPGAGNKRPHDDSSSGPGQQGNGGKRLRGGGGGA